MGTPLRMPKTLNIFDTFIDIGSLVVHGLIPPHMVHLHVTSCGGQVNASSHVFFVQKF